MVKHLDVEREDRSALPFTHHATPLDNEYVDTIFGGQTDGEVRKYRAGTATIEPELSLFTDLRDYQKDLQRFFLSSFFLHRKQSIHSINNSNAYG